MADDMNKKDGTPLRNAALSGGSRALTWLIALALVLITVQAGCSSSGTRSGAPASTTAGAPPAPGQVNPANPAGPSGPAAPSGPAGPANSAASPVPGGPGTGVTTVGPAGKSAKSGDIDMFSLMYGLLKLEKSPTPLKKEQAKKILAVFTAFDAAGDRDDYCNKLLDEVLTWEQKAFMKKKQTEIGDEKVEAAGTLDRKKAALDELRRAAGVQAAGELKIPADFKAPAGPPPRVSQLEIMWACLEDLQKDETLKLTREQAMKIMPIVEKSVELAAKDPPEMQIVAVLAFEQKTFVDKSVRTMVKEKPDIAAVSKTLLAGLREKAK